MKTSHWVTMILAVVAFAAALYFLNKEELAAPERTIGGDRDQYGCLIPAGFAYDEEVGACIRAFEMTPDIKRAAALAVDEVGKGHALTVVSFNSYEESGAYDIMLERGEERKAETVYIRNWEVVDKPSL